jgi:4-hydroxy-2-oxovalerate/4-hydroxy-2-oxohexanoate aldolase
MNLSGRRIVLHDNCLRDGMHAKRHQITLAQMIAVARGLDEAGVPLLEVTHGDGLGGASVNYGFPAHSDEEYLRAVIPQMKRARVSALLLPGIGTVEHLHLRATAARARCALPPTAPRRTFPSSTSAAPASSASTRSPS